MRLSADWVKKNENVIKKYILHPKKQFLLNLTLLIFFKLKYMFAIKWKFFYNILVDSKNQSRIFLFVVCFSSKK